MHVELKSKGALAATMSLKGNKNGEGVMWYM